MRCMTNGQHMRRQDVLKSLQFKVIIMAAELVIYGASLDGGTANQVDAEQAAPPYSVVIRKRIPPLSEAFRIPSLLLVDIGSMSGKQILGTAVCSAIL